MNAVQALGLFHLCATVPRSSSRGCQICEKRSRVLFLIKIIDNQHTHIVLGRTLVLFYFDRPHFKIFLLQM